MYSNESEKATNQDIYLFQIEKTWFMQKKVLVLAQSQRRGANFETTLAACRSPVLNQST